MKNNSKQNIFKFAFTSLFVLLMGSCEIIPEQPHTPTTANYFDVYRSWNTAIHQILNESADIAFRLNAYLSAPVAERSAVAANLLLNYQIQDNGDNSFSLLYNGHVVYRIEHTQTSLETYGAMWNITCDLAFAPPYPNANYHHYYQPFIGFYKPLLFTCTLQRNYSGWFFNIPNFGMPTIEMPHTNFLNLVLTTPNNLAPSTLANGYTIIQGSGTLSFVSNYSEKEDDFEYWTDTLYVIRNQCNSLSFDILNPMQLAAKNRWSAGRITIGLDNSGFQVRIENSQSLYIDIVGVSEQWQQPE